MKKLSDYRIREENGKFYVELMVKEITNRFLRKPIEEIKWVRTDQDGDRLIRYSGRYCLCIFEPCETFDTLEAAKAQIIKWCEEPKYHYFNNMPCPYDLSYGDIEYLAKCREEKERTENAVLLADLENILFVMMDKDGIAKTEQQMKEEITEKDVVDACKRQFDEKSTIPLTFEAKNMELQLENAKLKGILETLKKLTK